MFLNARNDLFEFEFPVKFFPAEIKERWVKYVERIPTQFESVKDFLNVTIQGVNTSDLSYEPAIQSGTTQRAERKWLASTSVSNTSSKELSITFKLIDGYANYFLMMELFDYWYSFHNEDNYISDFTLYTGDSDGNRLLQFELSDILFTGMDALQLNYSDNVQQFNTFEATFSYNRYKIKFPFD